MLGMRKKNERKTLRTRKKSHLNLSIINLSVTFLLIRIIKEKAVKKRLKPGIKLRDFLEATSISQKIIRFISQYKKEVPPNKRETSFKITL